MICFVLSTNFPAKMKGQSLAIAKRQDFGRNLDKMAERFAFTVEWYDPNAALTRTYQLLFYTEDEAVEMIDVKSRRLFLKKTPIRGLNLKDLFIGGIVTIHSRQLRIVDYGDEFTRKKLGSAKEKTLVMIKPDCMSKMGEIIDRVISEGFTICNAKTLLLTRKEAAEFYAEHVGKEFFERLLDLMTEGPILAFEINGHNAIKKWREILGPTDPADARRDFPESIRAQFGANVTRNACHGSDSIEAASRETGFFFGGKTNKGKSSAILKDSTLGVIKPHAVAAGLTGKIISGILSSGRGLEISALQLQYLEKVNAEEFLEVYKGVVREYTSMVEDLIAGPCIAMEITGKDAHSRFRELTGPADPEVARHLRSDTLRAKFGVDKIKNAVHCTDLPEDASLEVEYFFKILQ